MNDPSKRIALITGANKGIGFEIARELGKAGLIVLLGSRDARLGEEAAATLQAEKLDVSWMQLDVTSPESVEAAASSIKAQFERLDVLVNNAGINDPADGPPSAADSAAVARVIETNFLGAFRVTRAVLPLLRKATAARIVNVSSGLGSLTLNSDREWTHASVKLLGYCASGGDEYVDRPARLRTTGNRDQGKLCQSWLYRNRPQWISRDADGPARSRCTCASGTFASRRTIWRVFRCEWPAALVMSKPGNVTMRCNTQYVRFRFKCAAGVRFA